MKRLLVLLALLLPTAAPAQPASTVKDAMGSIEKTFGVYFVYNAGLPVDGPTTFRIDPEGNLQKNLRDLFADTGISWYVKKKYVVLNECCATLRQAPVWPEPTADFRVDTLVEAVKTAVLPLDRYETGSYQIDPVLTRRIVTPLGDGDAFKYIQQLPGISTGGESGLAYHVRGGNMGSNLVSLDGVPVYGLSHLMGLASVVPGDVVGTSEFRTGGFRADESNLTASHLRLQSYNGDFERSRARFSFNPFLISASVSTPMEKGKSSFLGSARISPIGLEYKALRNVVNKYMGDYSDFGATVGDLYGKFTWRRDARSETALSLFSSLDQYRFDIPEQSYSEQLLWSNLMANLSWKKRRVLGFDEIYTALSFTDHLWQNDRVEHRGYGNAISTSDYRVSSRLDEITFRSTACKRYDRWTFRAGLKVSGARFNPNAFISYHKQFRSRTIDSRIDHIIHTLTPTVYGEVGYEIPEKMEVRLALRANGYFAMQKEAEPDPGEIGKEPERVRLFHPEASLSVRAYLLPQLGIEGTFDYLTQYYHCLEEISLGWTLDPVVPSMAAAPPERALQGYLGLFGNIEGHSFRAGGFYKQMYDVVHYPKKTQVYHVKTNTYNFLLTGDGNAYGAEFLYEKEGPNLSWKIAYTWAKTERIFEKVNGGEAFPAKYDRRHMMNANICWKGLTATFTLQSGHRETITAFQYDDERYYPVDQETLSGYEPYNVAVPAHIRLDLGYQFAFRSGREHAHPLNHNLTVGVYNVLNRHNPSMLRFDSSIHQWKYVSFFPIMPSIRYILEL